MHANSLELIGAVVVQAQEGALLLLQRLGQRQVLILAHTPQHSLWATASYLPPSPSLPLPLSLSLSHTHSHTTELTHGATSTMLATADQLAWHAGKLQT